MPCADEFRHIAAADGAHAQQGMQMACTLMKLIEKGPVSMKEVPSEVLAWWILHQERDARIAKDPYWDRK